LGRQTYWQVIREILVREAQLRREFIASIGICNRVFDNREAVKTEDIFSGHKRVILSMTRFTLTMTDDEVGSVY
jgi:hypothetical protein